MNAEDFKIWQALTRRVAELADQLARLAHFGPDTSGELLADIAAVQMEVAAITTLVQDRAARAWRLDHPPSQPAPRRLHAPRRLYGLPLSTEIEHGVQVQRTNLTGRPVNEKPQTPAISGRWAANRRPKETLKP